MNIQMGLILTAMMSVAVVFTIVKTTEMTETAASVEVVRLERANTLLKAQSKALIGQYKHMLKEQKQIDRLLKQCSNSQREL